MRNSRAPTDVCYQRVSTSAGAILYPRDTDSLAFVYRVHTLIMREVYAPRYRVGGRLRRTP